MSTVIPFRVLKQRILKLTKGSIINLQVAKDKAGITGMISTEEDCHAVLKVLEKPRRVTPPTPQWVKDRYNEAHRLWFAKEYPQAWKDGQYTPPLWPDVHKSGGLTKFIVNYATWTGNYGNRINTMGYKGPNGKYRKTTTKKGTSDTILSIAGRMVCIEVKIGKNTPSEKQLEQQRKVRSSGGVYEFCRSAEMFLNIFDGIVYG